MVKYPNRYSEDYKHRDFGIENWLRKQGVYDNSIQLEIVDSFLSENGFKNPTAGKKIIRKSKSAFISNRFVEFCDFTVKYIKQNLRCHQEEKDADKAERLNTLTAAQQ